MGIRVLLVDDHPLFRQGLRQILQLYPDIEVVGEAVDGEHACQLVGELCPDVVVMDVHMPRMDGVRATQAMMKAGTPPAILILTITNYEGYALEAVRAGACGYYRKDEDVSEFICGLMKAAAGEALMGGSTVSGVLPSRAQPAMGDSAASALSRLDERELEILQRVAAGHTDHAIAATLGISQKTIKGLLAGVFQKLGLKNRQQATIFALRHELVTLEELEV
jgi:DNA-binding NarL/FixJ family response regulator